MKVSELKEKGSIGYIEEGQYILEQPTPFNMEQEELSLTGKHNIYNSLAANLQAAYARVQEVTPAFTTLQSATMPIEKAGPQGKKIVLVFVFLAFLGVTGYALWKENQFKALLGL